MGLFFKVQCSKFNGQMWKLKNIVIPAQAGMGTMESRLCQNNPPPGGEFFYCLFV